MLDQLDQLRVAQDRAAHQDRPRDLRRLAGQGLGELGRHGVGVVEAAHQLGADRALDVVDELAQHVVHERGFAGGEPALVRQEEVGHILLEHAPALPRMAARKADQLLQLVHGV